MSTHHRRSIRLRGYDYSQAGAYFITICAQNRECLFGEIVNDEMRLNDAGHMVQQAWDALPAYHPCVETDAFVVMPNHIHGIIVLTGPAVGAGLVPARDPSNADGNTKATTRVASTAQDMVTTVTPTVGDVVGAFKSRVTVEYIRGVKTMGWPGFNQRLWQRNYYEHVIRDEAALARIREYIENNPLQWALDRENPINASLQGKP